MTSARFLTVIEPDKCKPVVKSAVALSANRLKIELVDGRIHEIDFKNFEGSGKDIEVIFSEMTKGGRNQHESTSK